MSAVATKLGVHATVLRKWVRRFGAAATGTPRRPHTQVAAPLPADQAAEVARLRRENDRLRMERDIKKSGAYLRSTKMKFDFIHAHRAIWPVRTLCAALGLSVSGY